MRNDSRIINALSTLITQYQPDQIFTLDTNGPLVEDAPCDVQNGGVFTTNECDHYDHVGTARLTQSALAASGLDVSLREFQTYRLAAGLSVGTQISQQACDRFCSQLDTYLSFDTRAQATPWGPFLTAPDKFTIATSPPPPPTFAALNSRVVSALGSGNNCLVAEGTTDGSLIKFGSCDNAPNITLSSQGVAKIGPGCIGVSSSGYGATIRLQNCSGAASQKWRYDQSSRVIRHVESNLVIDVPASSVPYLYPFHGGANQQWTWNTAPESASPPPTSTSTALNSRVVSALGSGNSCLVAEGTTDGSLIKFGSCDNAPNITLSSLGVAKIGPGCIGVSSSGYAATIRLQNCSGAASQKWRYDQSSRSIRHVESNLVIDVPASSVPYLHPFHGGANQQWTWNTAPETASPPPTSTSTALNSRVVSALGSGNSCLVAEGGTDGSLIKLGSCANAPSLTLSSQGVAKIGPGCIGVSSSGYGATIRLQNCSGAASQKWRYERSSKSIRHVESNLVIDVPFSSATPDVPYLYPLHGGANQQWTWN